MKTTTACLRDCHDTCSLVITTSKSGKATLKGNPDHPFTRGFVCAKIQDQPAILGSLDRITEPQLKVGEAWQSIGWDQALDLCSRKIQALRSRPEAIVHIKGAGSMALLPLSTVLFFSSLGATSVKGSLCNGAAIAAGLADFGTTAQNDPALLAEAKYIVNWGRDFNRSAIHQAAIIKQARKKGCRVLTISTGGDDCGALTDDRILIRPGRDRFLAAALIKSLLKAGRVFPRISAISSNWPEFKETIESCSISELLSSAGLARSELELALSYYQRTDEVATIIGWGLQRHANGGESVRFIDALAMSAGKVGTPGGGVYTSAGSNIFNLSWASPNNDSSPRYFLWPTIGQEIRAAKDPRVEMVWVNGSNVLSQSPDSRAIAQAFKAVDFKVVVDGFMTDTAALADLVLPCTLNFEQEDIIGSYTHPYINYSRPACQPPAQARTDHWIVRQLGRRLDPQISIPTQDEIFRTSLDSPVLETSLEELREAGFARMTRAKVAFSDLKFGHPDGLYRFPDRLTPAAESSADYPLTLLSLIRREATHSQMLPVYQETPPKVWLAPDSPAWQGFDPAAKVYLATSLGRMQVQPNTLEGLHPEAVVYRRGDWISRGGGVNQIIEARLTDLGNLAAYYSQQARLEN